MRDAILPLGLVASLIFCANCLGQSYDKTPPISSASGIRPQERQALIALYEATDGNHWKNHNGWLGPAGSECKWYGIICASHVPPIGVTDIELSDNNLSGSIPDSIGDLTQLESFFIFGNRLSGRLPDVLIQRWLSGALWINAEASMLTDVSEVDFESSASALLCASHRIILHSDGSAVLFTERCRNRTPKDRATFCEEKEGQIGWSSFATLARRLEKSGFYTLKPEYSFNVTDATFKSTRAIRATKTYEVVEYAGGGPFELTVIHGFIEGLVTTADWQKTKTIPKCPRWESKVH